MRSPSLVVSAVVSLAAPVAFVVAYQSWSPSPTAMAARAPAQRTVSATTTAPTKVRLRPCEAGTRLRHGVCVSHRVRTVVVPVVPAPPRTPPISGAAPAPDDQPGFQGDDADEPTATPDPGEQDDDDQSPPSCAVQHDSDRQRSGASDSQCDDDESAEAEPPQETEEPGEDDGGDHESDGGNGGGTGSDD